MSSESFPIKEKRIRIRFPFCRRCVIMHRYRVQCASALCFGRIHPHQIIPYPGIAKLVSRLVWDQETVRSSRTTRTKIPLKSLISEGFFLFFVYCGADGEMDTHTLHETSCIVQHSNRFSIHLYKYNSVEFVVEWEYNIY